MLTVVHCTRDLDQASGGPARSVPALARAQAAAGNCQVILLAGESSLPLLPQPTPGLHVQLLRDHWTAWLEHHEWLLGNDDEVVLHVHGLWSLPAQRVARWAIRRGVPLVISPRGMLEAHALRHKWAKKKLGWYLYQKRVLTRSSLIHATSTSELDSIRRQGIMNPAMVLANGVELATDMAVKGTIEKSVRTVGFLGRLHPIKNLAALIQAWGLIQASGKNSCSGWRLMLAGMDEDGYQRHLEQLIESLGLANCVTFTGRLEGDAKANFFREIDLFVLPSLSENFGISVAEALASGVPVIASRGTPWSELESWRCGWWTNADAASLADALRRATSESDESRRSMGERGKALIQSHYLWPPIASQMLEAYRWLIKPTSRPDWIR